MAERVVKICGLTDETAVAAAVRAGADMIGFVVCDRSPRHLPLDRARELSKFAGGGPLRVLLTVNADISMLDAAVAAIRPHCLQFHGSETPEHIGSMRERFGINVMRAIAIRSHADLEVARSFDTVCDRLLFDAPPPPDAERSGGHGVAFDWSLLRGAVFRCPWMLAGGLDAGNVGEALHVTKAQGVDVSSGVESAPGRKDPAKIAAFVAAVRAASRLDADARFS